MSLFQALEFETKKVWAWA